MGGLAYRLLSLHLGISATDRDHVARIRRVERLLRERRGRIYDGSRDANILALDLEVKDVIADPSILLANNELELATEQIAEVAGLDEAEVMGALDRPGRRYARVCRNMQDEQSEAIRDLGLRGISLRDATKRYYPHNSFMCHVIGFLNGEGVGGSGVEQGMNGFLRGCPGLVESVVDGRRRELYDRRVQDIPAKTGADICLTLDQNVQYMAERALDEVMERHGAKGAWVIVERVRTGEIVAMASRPSYDLNDFGAASQEELLNRAIGFVYEPGSTMKALSIAAALNERIAERDTILNCEDGAWLHQGKVLRDYHPYGRLTVADIVKKSSNIGTAKLTVSLGAQKLSEYLTRFGIGSKTGIDLPGEEQGILHPVRRWSRISCSRIGIGQGVSVTALQMLNALCAIANDGVVMRPYIVSRVVSSDGVVLHEGRPKEVGRAISSQTASIMRQLLSRVTEAGGTGTRARVRNYSVAGKTGTAQKPIDGGYSSSAYVASFVGFVPADAPELGIIVVVDEPQPLHTGGVVAAPAFSTIASEALSYFDIPVPRIHDGTEIASTH
jgi:cell division protein FtsI (penicillin-binding protein 3)